MVWRDEIAPRLGDPEGTNYLEDFPGGRFYWLTAWETSGGVTVIVAESNH